MFVILLDYLVPLPDVDATLQAHSEWLDAQYQAGLFLASGRREPRVGGVILAIGSAEAVAAAVAEFHPSRFGGVLDVESVRERLQEAR